jgi:hypothetical protein
MRNVTGKRRETATAAMSTFMLCVVAQRRFQRASVRLLMEQERKKETRQKEDEERSAKQL